MPQAIPEIDIDPFSHDSVRNARAVDDGLRELAPVVKLRGEDVLLLGRHAHVAAGLADWRSFSSTSRPWHDPNSVRPELLLTDDPPKHTRVRAVIANTLTPKALTLLEYLMLHPQEVHSRDRLLSTLWGFDFATTSRAVDHRIAELRRVLGDNTADAEFIETVQNMGYLFAPKVVAG